GDTVLVQSKQISKPVYVRYLFEKPEPDPEVSLINAEGLPASSFITDDFKPHREPLPEYTQEQRAADQKKKEKGLETKAIKRRAALEKKRAERKR
ncbi:MAG: hypothetical protein KAR47_18140, partial [Planctomycetes bacterium]|nr:hypothetical protein [Planctomycetota bacterium]